MISSATTGKMGRIFPLPPTSVAKTTFKTRPSAGVRDGGRGGRGGRGGGERGEEGEERGRIGEGGIGW